MFAKYLMTSSLVAAIALTPMASAPAQAQDARDVIGGLLLGGAIGVAIGAASQQPRTRVIVPQQPQTQPARPSQPRVVRPAIPATEAGRQVQTALNYFGFDAGFVDGQVGPATRSAVERYQAFQGYPVNGRSFPEPQALHLIQAYQWANNGGAAQTGLRGQPLLNAYAQHLAGTLAPATPLPATTVVPAGATAATTTVIVNPATTTVVPAPGTNGPVQVVAATSGGAIPNLFAGASTAPSLSSRCDAVALQGQANGGMMTLGTLSNPGFALSEQFCVARAGAVSQGQDLTQAIPNLTLADITVQCEGFSDAIAAQTAVLDTMTPQQALGSAQGFAYSTGIPQAELAGTARVCLGVGYDADDMEMALGSALILVSTGEPAYGELLGHHLREGFGIAANGDAARAWYDISLTAVEAGAPSVFNPADAGRLPLIRQAVAMTLGGQPVPVPAAAPAAPAAQNALPTFQVNQ
ncbi:peptidoglycan-binding protein [Rhodobacteraceae bacterium N5(2021)]|uniref:Peptidoglycan-binding protein n=1 Tax=Gymnodinialimonas phycosphaerae TaxID=2841589 RepID=A0A975YFY4_9RHOB|nr:peptidoglycan-binding domain-containing protein [Gymnodinialimonas phycosphaerae]MBY4895283.1 peptidoglycan-binding protein [Gymnodinialimonas phycosphaerae]